MTIEAASALLLGIELAVRDKAIFVLRRPHNEPAVIECN